METRVRSKMKQMDPDAQAFLEGFLGERYRSLLIYMIVDSADLSSPVTKKPVLN